MSEKRVDQENFDFAKQRAGALKVREKIVSHLKYSDKPMAAHFRNSYQEIAAAESSSPRSFQRYIARQSRNFEWGTAVEAAAFGEMCNINVRVVEVTNDDTYKAEYMLYEVPGDKKVPTVTLYNRDNKHWFVSPNTLGDGNCLFNALTQLLHSNLQPLMKPITPAKAVSEQARFEPKIPEKILRAQQHAYETANSHRAQGKPLYALHVKQQVAEAKFQKAYKGMSDDVKKQISDDFNMAVKLAQGEEASSPDVKINKKTRMSPK